MKLQAFQQLNAIIEMQQFFPTDSFNCVEELFVFDACVRQAGQDREPTCILPFQNWSSYPDIQNRLCKTHAEGYASFQQFQLTSIACKVPCIQINTVFNYNIPQYLRAKYLQYVKQNSKIFPNYLHLPSSIKVSKASPSYGFITFLAEVAGWYNLFLGGSIFSMWEILGTKIMRKLGKIWGKMVQCLSKRWNIPYILLSIGILAYVFIDCITKLILNPVGSTTLLSSSVSQGLSLSICLPLYTSVSSESSASSRFMDIANSTSFWVHGNNLSNKISDLSVITQQGDVLLVWNTSQSTSSTHERNLFQIFNIVSSDSSVDFCHTVDLSSFPGHISGLKVRAVNDIELVIHLPGHLLASQNKYVVANTDTVKSPSEGGSLDLYNSVVRLQLEETSFQNVSTPTCKNYNKTWTYDSCVMNYVTSKSGDNRTLLMSLLFPSRNSTVQQGIERAVLQSLYVALLSKNIETVCLPDCRSLIVNMRAEAIPKIDRSRFMSVYKYAAYAPLPPLLIEVNVTLPDLSKLNQVIIYILCIINLLTLIVNTQGIRGSYLAVYLYNIVGNCYLSYVKQFGENFSFFFYIFM
jgi:hypothetical protein